MMNAPTVWAFCPITNRGSSGPLQKVVIKLVTRRKCKRPVRRWSRMFSTTRRILWMLAKTVGGVKLWDFLIII